MDNFWKWLIKANARAVFVCALLVLLLVIAWYAWRVTRPVAFESLPQSPQTGERNRPRLGIIAYLDQQYDENKMPAGRNPFAAPPAQPVTNVVVVVPETNTTATSKPPVKKPDPPRKVDVLNITFRGYMKRTDGKEIVFIEDSKSKAQKPCVLNDKVHGITITGVGLTEVKGQLEGGGDIILKLNTPAVFEDGKYVRPK
ncbi:MAG: hypothetical protein C0404_13965 [Verrucomicrobia bacterium]|nr:hypothetical protein [Verrucomicrobiota bacterium]